MNEQLDPDPDEQVELGEEVAARRERPSGPVVAIRIPRDVVAKLSAYAAARNLTVSEVVRQAAVSLVSERTAAGPFYVTGAALAGPNIISGAQPATGGRVMNRDYEGERSAALITRSS